MSNSAKGKRQYKDFVFRRRHDHFLGFKLLDASSVEVIDIAQELGFNFNHSDLPKKRKGKKDKSPISKSKNAVSCIPKFARRILRRLSGFARQYNKG